VSCRIVDRHGTRTDQDGVAQRAHAMHVHHVLGAGHPARLAFVGGDEAVEALTQMADGDRPSDRGVQMGR
jgi:hypothetical protein